MYHFNHLTTPLRATANLLAVGSFAIALTTSAGAQVTWNGGGGNDLWGTGTNWIGGNAPTPGTTTDIAFGGATRLTPNNNYTAFDDFRNILFNSGAGSFTITGNAIDLFGKIENNSTTLQTFNLVIGTGGVSGGFIEIDPTAGDLNIGGTDIFLGDNQLRVWGNNGKTLTFGASTIISGTGGSLAINQNSNVVFQSTHTYTGSSFINAGKLVIAAGGSANNSTLNLLDTSGANNATLELSPLAGGLSLTSPLIVRTGGTGVAALSTLNTSGTNTLGGAVTLNRGLTISSTAGGTLALTGAITGGSSLTLGGGGTVVLTGANSYSGGTTVNSGTLQIGNGASNGTLGSGAYSVASGAVLRLNYATATAPTWANVTGAGTLSLNSAQAVNGSANWGAPNLGAGFTGTLVLEKGRINTIPANLGGTTAVDVRSGAQVLFFDNTANTYTYPQNFTIAGTGWGEGGQPGALRVSVQNAIITGTVALSADATIYTQGSSGAKLSLNGVVSGSSNLTVQDSSTQGITLGAANTFTGTTTVSAGSLKLTNALALQNSTLTTGSVVFDSTVGGNAFTLGGLSGSGNITLQNNAGSPAAVELAIGNNNAATIHSGILSGPGSVSKIGTGTLSVTGASTYTGATTARAGVLSTNLIAPNGTASGIGGGSSLVLDGGTFQYTGGNNGSDVLANQFNRAITVSANGGTIDTTTGFLFYNGVISGTGPLTILSSTGGGKQWLITSSSPGFSGPVAIGNASANSGWVQYRSNSASPLGTGPVTLNAGGVLSADNGSTTPSTMANPIVLNGGFLGTQTPTMTYTGAITVNPATTSTVGHTANGNGETILTGNITGSGTVSSIGGTGVKLGGDNSGFTGTWQVTSAQTWFNTATSGSAGAAWVANGSNFIGNIAGGGTVALGSLSGTSGTIKNDIAATTANFSVGALGTNTSYGGTITDKVGDATSKTALTKVGIGTLTLTGSNTYTGGTTVTAGVLELGNGTVNGATGTGAYSIASGTTLRLNYLTAVSPTWSGVTGSGTLDLASAQPVNGTANWGALNLSAGFTGSVILKNGRINTTPAQLGGATSVDVRSGAQVLFFDGSATNFAYPQNFIIAGNGWGEAGQPGALRASIQTATIGGTITLTADSTIYTQNATTGSIVANGVVSGAFNLTAQASGGVISLNNGANSYSGTTSITAGTLVATTLAPNGSNSSIGTNSSLILNGGTMRYSGGNNGNDTLAAQWNRTVNVASGGGTIDLTSGFLFYNGTLTGSGTLNINSSGLTGANAKQLLLTGNSPAFDGPIVVNGAVQLRSNNAQMLGSTLGSTTINASGLLSADNAGSAVNVSIAENIMLNGGILGTQMATLTLTGTLDIPATSELGHTYGNQNGILNLNGSITGNGVLKLSGNGGDPRTSAGYVRIGGSGTNSFSGDIQLIRERLELGKTTGNAFSSGNMIIGSASVAGSRGVLMLQGSQQIPDTSTVSFQNQAGNFGFFDLNGNSETIGGLVDSTTRGVVEATENGTNQVATLRINNADPNVFSGMLRNSSSGTGNLLHLTKGGAGVLSLTGSNTYSGITTLSEGVLNSASFSDYGSPSSIGNRASDSAGNVGILFQGGTLQYTGALAQSTNRAIRLGTSGGTIDASGSDPSATLSFTATSSPDLYEGSGPRSLTLTGSNAGINTLATGLADNGGATSLNKMGSGTWLLSGVSTYTGATSLTGGTLLLGASDVVPDNAPFNLSGGAKFSTGGFNETTGSATLTGSGILDLGGGAGTSVLAFNNISGSWSGTLSIWNWNGTINTAGDFDNTRLLFNAGSLSPTQLSQVQFYSDNGNTPVGAGGTFVGNELVAVPEPTVLISSFMLLGIAAVRRRRSIEQNFCDIKSLRF